MKIKRIGAALSGTMTLVAIQTMQVFATAQPDLKDFNEEVDKILTMPGLFRTAFFSVISVGAFFAIITNLAKYATSQDDQEKHHAKKMAINSFLIALASVAIVYLVIAMLDWILGVKINFK